MLVLSIVLAVGAAQPTHTVRGKLCRDRAVVDCPPVARMAVRLNHPDYGPSGWSYSGTDGMYYVPNVPLGRFRVEVWRTSDPKDMLVVTVDVKPDGQMYADVPPLRVY
jgi:hypothetical protein